MPEDTSQLVWQLARKFIAIVWHLYAQILEIKLRWIQIQTTKLERIQKSLVKIFALKKLNKISLTPIQKLGASWVLVGC
jgi:hypothetical protein